MDQYIQLQGVGKHYAIPAKDLKPGMIACWNFGYTSIVKAVEVSKSGKSVTVTTAPRSNDEIRNGAKEYQRRFGTNRLVAVEKGIYAEEYAERTYIDQTSREFLYDHGARIDDSSGMIYISRQQFDRLSHTDRSTHDQTKRTWMIPTTNGICLIIEGKHFTVTEA